MEIYQHNGVVYGGKECNSVFSCDRCDLQVDCGRLFENDCPLPSKVIFKTLVFKEAPSE